MGKELWQRFGKILSRPVLLSFDCRQKLYSYYTIDKLYLQTLQVEYFLQPSILSCWVLLTTNRKSHGSFNSGSFLSCSWRVFHLIADFSKNSKFKLSQVNYSPPCLYSYIPIWISDDNKYLKILLLARVANWLIETKATLVLLISSAYWTIWCYLKSVL